MKRVYYRYEMWEETKAGMWRRPTGDERQRFVRDCGAFMASTEKFRAAMERVISEWPVSCEVNLSTSAGNRLSWTGRAATCIATGCPEEPTRAAWWTLTQRQRDDADAAAAEVIKLWEQQQMIAAGKPHIGWDVEKLQWRLTLPTGGSRLFGRKRWLEAVEYAIAWSEKRRRAA